MPTAEDKHYSLPENLTDGNQDGFADEGDFIRSFNNLQMSPWELRQLFLMVDTNGNGQVDAHEWRNFHDMFITKFAQADKDQDLLLKEKEFTDSFSDLAQLSETVKDGTSMKQLINDISGRQDLKDGALNFFEWMFVRRVAVAWGISNSRQTTINKVELLDAAIAIMIPFNQHDGQLKNTIFSALDFKRAHVTYSFPETCNLFHKFMIFTSMKQHSATNGALSSRKILKCIDDTVGPSELFLIENQSKAQTIQQAFAL